MAPPAPPAYYLSVLYQTNPKYALQQIKNIQKIQEDTPKEKHPCCLQPFASLHYRGPGNQFGEENLKKLKSAKPTIEKLPLGRRG